jgi:hypothetical protein
VSAKLADARAAAPSTLVCRLCGEAADRRFERLVLDRHRVGYYTCRSCGLTQTDDPTWLDEAYAHPIHPTDTGLLARNLGARRVVASFLALSGVGDRPCVDYAGGYGVFVRLMRDAGFHFHWCDPYARNLLAQGWEWKDGMGRPFACTAFEVLEHFVRPLEEFQKIAALGADYVITSTELPPAGGPAPDWHYLSVESGQHVSFYQPRTLERLGRASGYPVVLTGPYVQVFARAPFPAWKWRAAVRLAPILYTLARKSRRSLTVDDCETMRRSLRSE